MPYGKLPHLMEASIEPRTEICGNLGLPFTMLPCLHQSNVYIKRKLQAWRVHKCIPLVGAKTALTCAGLQTTPFQVSQCRAENENLRKSGSTFRHGTVFAPKQCVYQKEATRMESQKNAFLKSVQEPHLPVLYGKLPHLMEASIEPRTEICGNLGLPFAMLPCLHQSNVYIKRKLQAWRVQKCIPLLGAKTALTCVGRQTTPSQVSQYRADNGNLRKSGSFAMLPCFHKSNVHIKSKLQAWRVQKCISVIGGKTALTCAGRKTTPSHVSQYKVENGNLRKSGSTFYHGFLFAPNQCLYQKCIPLVGAKTALNGAGRQTTPSDVSQYRAENGNFMKSGLPLPWYRVCTKGMFISKVSYRHGESKNAFL